MVSESNSLDLDQKILDILKNDSRKSFVDIGKEIGLSESAVRRRVRNLV
ncbi:MAG: AsnC family protein, partial [Nitrososphaeraceae archaeon]